MPTMIVQKTTESYVAGVQPAGAKGVVARHYAVFDGLRGVAILAVMIYHFSGGYKGTNGLLRTWGLVADAGWMGVDLFFVLSGFLITGILYDSAAAKHKVKNFYIRRSLRIFPLFYAVLFTLLLLSRPLHLHWRPEHITYFLYLSNVVALIYPRLVPPSNWVNLGHLWSLAVEEQFYLLWPFVVWHIRRREILLQLIAVVLIVAPVLRGLLLMEGMSPVTTSRLLFTRADSLLFGAGVALLVRTPSPRRLPARGILAGAALVLSICLFAAHGPDASSFWLATVGYSAIAAFCASVIYLAREGDALIAKFFDRSFLRFFGRYSYGLYLFHGIYFVYLRHLSGSLQDRVHSGLMAQLLIIGFGFAVSVALAVLSYHVFESPFLKLKSRFT